MRWIFICALLMIGSVGCSMKQRSALLLERFARGPIEDAPAIGKRTDWQLEPATQTSTQKQVEVTVTHASQQYLRTFFGNRKLFGEFAGQNPYFPQHLVFYVKIANRSKERIRISPSDFALVDDHGNQYSPLNVDYVTAYAEYRAPVSTMTRGILEEARPGYFGFSVPVGKILLPSKPKARFALIQQSSLQTGTMHPGVMHDGLVSFWSPDKDVKSLQLLITNIKTDFNAADLPNTTLEFAFTFRTDNP